MLNRSASSYVAVPSCQILHQLCHQLHVLQAVEEEVKTTAQQKSAAGRENEANEESDESLAEGTAQYP